jgi:hypothetical protein
LSSRNLSTKDLSASAPVVNEVVLGRSVNKAQNSSEIHRRFIADSSR